MYGAVLKLQNNGNTKGEKFFFHSRVGRPPILEPEKTRL